MTPKMLSDLINLRAELKEAIKDAEAELAAINAELLSLTPDTGMRVDRSGKTWLLQRITPKRVVVDEAGVRNKYGSMFDKVTTSFDTKAFEKAISKDTIPASEVSAFVTMVPLTSYIKVTEEKEVNSV